MTARTASWLLALLLAQGPDPPRPALLAPSVGARLLFRSGFEGGTRLPPPVDCWPLGCWQHIAGDTAAGGGRFLLLTDPVPVTAFSVEHYMLNRLENVRGPAGKPTRALYQLISRNVNGTAPMGASPAQNGLQLQPDAGVRELYLSFLLKLQPDLAARMRHLPAGPGVRDGGTWRALFALKTGGPTTAGAPADDGDYRIEAYVTTYGGGRPYWAILGDNNAGGGAPLVNAWSESNRRVRVPLGKWCRIEFYWRRSDGADGRVWMAVDGQVIADRHGANTGAWNLPLNRIFAPLLYGGGRLPMYQWVDDVEVWSGVPPLNH